MSGPTELCIRSDALEVTLLPELGGRIHRIRAFGADLLHAPDDAARHATEPVAWGAYPMVPWCNRAPAGPREIAGRTIDLQSNFDDGTAIHGLVFERPWERRPDGSLAIAGGGAGEAWPWRFEVSMVPSVEGARLELRYALRNLSDGPMPAGIGLHPWFVRPLEVRMPAERVYASNIGSEVEPVPALGAFDLGRLGPPADGLDATWAGLEAPAIDLGWPALGIGAVLEARTNTGSILVALASPASIGAVAIEPQTHGPDPIRRLIRDEPDAPALLAPGRELTLSVGLTVFRSDDTGPGAG
jgi:aldose 1-epimerase